MSDNPSPNRNARDHGLGYVESLLVIGLALAILLLAVPGFHRLQLEWSLWGATNLLASSLQWARMYAVSANTSVSIEIDESGKRFYCADASTGETYANSLRYLPGDVRIVSSPRRSVRFFPRGNAAPAGTFTLRGGAGQYRVIVNLMGRIRVQKD